MPTKHPLLQGIAFVMFSVLVWSGWMVFSSHGVRGTLTAYDLTALRFGTAALVMLPILIRRGLRVGPWGVWSGILLSSLMGATYNTLTIYGMKFAPVSHMGLINTGMLVMTTLGGIFLLKEKTTKLRILGILISISGIGCLLIANPSDNGLAIHIGHAAFFIGGSMWAVYALLMKRWQLDGLHVAAAVCVYSGVLYMPIYLLFLPHNINAGNLNEAIFQAGYQGIINSVFALICYNRAIQLLGAMTSSAFLPLIPVIATVTAIPLLNEYPMPLEWIGIGLASGGVMLSTGIVGRWFGQKDNVAG